MFTPPPTIIFEGVPVPWAAHQGYGKRSYNPRFREKEQYQYLLKKQVPPILLEGPISLNAIFEMPIPKTTTAKNKALIKDGRCFPIKRPDVDNLIKFLNDILKGYLFVDDSQVVELVAKKIYSYHPQTIVHLKPL